jgi:hypothetical protein
MLPLSAAAMTLIDEVRPDQAMTKHTAASEQREGDPDTSIWCLVASYSARTGCTSFCLPQISRDAQDC